MSMYNKLFTKILDSSIWLESMPTRIVWLTIIAVMDEDGFAQFASVANVAHRARVTLKEAQAAIQCLEGPDENSSNPDNDGRRLERVPGGWMVLNSQKHREMVTRAIIQGQTRERVKRFRDRVKRTGNADVTPSEAVSEVQAEADTETTTAEITGQTRTLADVRGSSPLIVSPLQFDRLRAKNAFVGSRLRIPHVLHDELRTKLGADGEAKLQAWYLTLDEAVEASGEAIPDIFTWLRPRFVAWCESQGVVKPATNGKGRHATPAQSRQDQATARVKELIALGKSRKEAMEMASQEFGL